MPRRGSRSSVGSPDSISTVRSIGGRTTGPSGSGIENAHVRTSALHSANPSAHNHLAPDRRLHQTVSPAVHVQRLRAANLNADQVQRRQVANLNADRVHRVRVVNPHVVLDRRAQAVVSRLVVHVRTVPGVHAEVRLALAVGVRPTPGNSPSPGRQGGDCSL